MPPAKALLRHIYFTRCVLSFPGSNRYLVGRHFTTHSLGICKLKTGHLVFAELLEPTLDPETSALLGTLLAIAIRTALSLLETNLRLSGRSRTWILSNMVSHPSHHAGGHNQDFDDAEKGYYGSTQSLTALPLPVHLDSKTSIYIDCQQSPKSLIHEDISPFSSTSKDTEPSPKVKEPARPKRKISIWIRFRIWFNTYRKFFTFVTLLNLTGIIMAALGRFPYADNHLGALVLGNLLGAILMRNELFLRFLYIIAIYGLRSVRRFLHHPHRAVNKDLIVGSIEYQAGSHFGFATCWRHPFGMCDLRRWVRNSYRPKSVRLIKFLGG